MSDPITNDGAEQLTRRRPTSGLSGPAHGDERASRPTPARSSSRTRCDSKPILTVDNLRMYFPVKNSGIIRRTVGYVQAVDGISFQVPEGGSLGLVGESGCGKSTTGRLITRLYKPTEGVIDFDGKDIAKYSAAAADAAPARDPDDLPGPGHVAEPAAHRRHHRRRAAADPQRGAQEQGDAEGPGAARGGRPQPRALQPLPARVLRRSAPAHRHRPGAHPAAQAAGGRRAGVRARRLDPGAGDQPAPGPAERVQDLVPVHRARPRGGASLLPRGGGDVPRQDRRGGRPGHDLPAAAPPLHAGPAVRGPRRAAGGGRRSPGADPPAGRRTQPDQPAVRAAGSAPGARSRRTSAPGSSRR